MALSAATVWEVQTGGNAANGGGFVTGASGTDYSQSGSPHVTIDGATITAVVHSTTTQLNITGYTVAAGDVGNILQISGGTATAGWYQITVADVANNRWTVDRSAGTAAQTATGRMGGCFASPGGLGAALAAAGVNGQKAFIKAGTYTLSTSTPNVSGGPLSLLTGTSLYVEGYQTTRGDLGTAPVINAGSVGSITILSAANVSGTNTQMVVNIEVDGNSQASVLGISIAAHANGNRLTARNCTSGGINSSSPLSYCLATGCTGFGITTIGGYALHAINNAGASTDGIRWDGTTNVTLVACLAHNNGRYGIATAGTSRRCLASLCIADGNGNSGFFFTAAHQGNYYVECVATNNGGYGFEWTAVSINNTNALIRCANKSNTSGRTNAAATLNADLSPITLTADPYVDQANDDFNINNTAGGGALLRAVSVTL